MEATLELIGRARSGDERARDELFARAIPLLRRWAHQRIPASVRDLQETEDLVQTTVMRACRSFEGFDARGPGAFLGYLRQILLNAIRDELRRVAGRPGAEPLESKLASPGASPLEELIGAEAVARYEGALLTLPEETREAVLLRIELGLSFQEIADLTGKPSANAARMTVARALIDLAEEMHKPHV